MLSRKNKRNESSKGMELEDYLFSVSEKESSGIEIPMEKRKMGFFWIIILCLLFVLSARVFYLNLIKGAYYREIAKGNSIRSIPIKAPRGRIFDRFGNTLVNNVPSIDAIAILNDLPKDPENLKNISTELSKILSLNEKETFAKLTSFDKSSVELLLIKENISQDESLVLEEKKNYFPGIITYKTAIREYSDSSIFSHVLGYVGKIDRKELDENSDYFLTDYIGKQGIEKSYEKYLKGKNGAVKVEVDSLGNVKKERGAEEPEAGSNLILGIDYELQKKIFDELNDVLEKTDTRTAAAVAIDPRNGEIRALISLPGFDNNLFSGKISESDYSKLVSDPQKPLFNRAISGEYPPGSTIKPLIATAALSENVITPSTIIDGLGGNLSIGSYHFGDWKAHGPSDVRMAIAQSNDIFFYTVGGGYGNIQGLGMDRMKKYENLLGLGNVLGIDIPGEASGFIPDTQWKLDKLGERWYTGDDYHAAIGQGFVTATPLQIASYIATIANGGTLYKPHIVSKIIDGNNKAVNNSSFIIGDKLINPGVIKVVQEGMREVITSGTAQVLKDLPVDVAGKTGTAQFGSENKTHAWFVSYAPYENPELVLVILVEGGGEGHSSAVPITKAVYDWYFNRKQ
ncbi:MAG: penicillin-binding protein 2 [bacterium]|nr:penicillin-binding protein 2 [bacterium]